MFLNEGKLKDVKLNKGEYGYTLTVTYEVTDKVGNIHLVTLHSFTEQISTKVNMGFYEVPGQSIDIGYGMIGLPDNFKHEDKIVKYTEKEMTIEEIEKQLGHKVKIVNKKED